MNFGFESMANLGETGSFVEVVGLITDINLARLRQCVHRIQNLMDKREKEVLKEKLLLAVENVKKSFKFFFYVVTLSSSACLGVTCCKFCHNAKTFSSHS